MPPNFFPRSFCLKAVVFRILNFEIWLFGERSVRKTRGFRMFCLFAGAVQIARCTRESPCSRVRHGHPSMSFKEHFHRSGGGGSERKNTRKTYDLTLGMSSAHCALHMRIPLLSRTTRPPKHFSVTSPNPCLFSHETASPTGDLMSQVQAGSALITPSRDSPSAKL